MTWGEFKALVEKQGVEDEDKLWSINIFSEDDVVATPNEEGFGWEIF